MNARIVVNLVFFAVLGCVLAVWSATSLLRLDLIERPFAVTAEFASSPGLHPDLQVTYLGVPVGRVASVTLRPGRVAVLMELDHHTKVPAGAGARVLRKSAVGEPYVELTAPTGPTDGVLKAGDTVPLARTSGTVDYQELFTGLGDTLNAVDPADAGKVVHELATGVAGHGDTLRDLIGDTGQLTATLAANADVLSGLATELTDVTGTLAAHRRQLTATAGNLADVSASVRTVSGDLVTVLEHGPGFFARVETLLQKSRPGLACLLAAGATPGPPVFDKKTEATVEHVLTLLPTFQALLKDTAVVTPQGTFLRATALVSIAGPKAAADYLEPTPKPVWKPAPVCPATPGAAKADDKKRPSAARPDPGPSASTAAPAAADPTAVPAKRIADWSGVRDSLPLLPVVLAAAVLGAVAIRSALTFWSSRRRDH
ncbi:MCE family protein [Actinocorallia sp. API 0066]|uniref:MCE family protein n=1 Tax=Actinocorallia sp. API 0066 TaxID=2896846 RepID=UPI001E40A095|nr:MCE family protein [Actinocorallia sp. API 0066]MCD0449365.1 MCE family protein [Actinocorallia sp. API 0066]